MDFKGIREINIKELIVAIGIANKNSNLPSQIVGSGFLINDKGFVLTAKHVIRECINLIKDNSSQEVAAFYITITGLQIKVNKLICKNYASLESDRESDYYIDEDVDIALMIPLIEQDTKYFEIKTDPLKVYDDVCICGYPGGNASLNISNDRYNFRFSPMVQFGRISTLIPFDTKTPVKAIQTDIISTGGSSGSPIIDPLDGKVIGIATNVIGANISGYFLFNEKYHLFGGSAKIGPVFGPSSHYFYDMTVQSKLIAEGKDVRSKILLTHVGKLNTNSK
jgi:V8-like Glu-specific endopeptidase